MLLVNGRLADTYIYISIYIFGVSQNIFGLYFCVYFHQVRGMMYYRQALELQAFLDMAKDEGTCKNTIIFFSIPTIIGTSMISSFLFLPELLKGYKAIESSVEEHPRNERSLKAQCQAVADMKFTYVVSCQQYGVQKRSGDSRATDILRLMTKYAG